MKLKTITAAIFTSTSIILTGCSSSHNASTASFSGTVADGYISGAKVCLDINKNLKCDANEPSDTTNDNGKFTLNITAEQANQYAIIAEVGAGAYDTGRQINISSPYTMSSLPGKGQFTSPLTTLASAELASTPGMTEELVREKIANALGTSKLDLTEDYVAKTTDPDYKKALNAAPVIADLIANAITNSNLQAEDSAKLLAAAKKTLSILPIIKLHIEKDGDGELTEAEIEQVVNLLGSKVIINQVDLDDIEKGLALAENSNTLTVTDLLDKVWYEIDQDNPTQIIAYRFNSQGKTFQRAWCDLTTLNSNNCLAQPDWGNAQSSNFTLNGNTVTIENTTIQFTGGNAVPISEALVKSIAEELKDLLEDYDITIDENTIQTSLQQLVGQGALYTLIGIRPALTLPTYESESFDGTQLPWDSVTDQAELGATSVQAFIDALPEETADGTRPQSPISLDNGEYWAWLDNGKQNWKICEVKNGACEKDDSGNEIILTYPANYEAGKWQSGESYVQIIDPKTLVEDIPATYVLTEKNSNGATQLYEAWYQAADKPFFKTVFDQRLAEAVAQLILDANTTGQ